MLRPFAVGSLLALASVAFCQRDLLGPGEYPQFRTLSGLPGGGYGVRPDGTPDFDGAMAFSTPIGYSLSNFHIVSTAANTSDYSFFRFPHVSGNSGSVDSLGKFSTSLGGRLGKFGSLTSNFMIISSYGDSTWNYQYQAPLFYKGIGVSAGIQDLAGKRGDRSGSIPGIKGSRSAFGVVTVPLPYGVYASAGWGTLRFIKGFGNISAPVGNRFKVVLEHDGYGLNEAMGYDMRALDSWKLFGRGAKTTMLLGFVKSKYAFWSLSLAF